MGDDKKVIAVWGLTNTASLNVWDVKDDEAVLVGINDDEPEWFEIEWQVDEDAEDEDADSVAGINFHGSFYRLDECMRVGR